MSAVSFVRRSWLTALVGLIALYLLLRVEGLRDIVTTDEPFWLGRSANFYRALWQVDLVHTFQHAHPGVTTMWAGMVGYWFAAPGYVDLYDTNLGNVYGIHERLRAMGLLELDVLVAARIAKIVVQTALFTLSLWLLRRIFGVVVAVLAAGLIALNPFLIAHDRLLHVDGLLAISALAAVLMLVDAVVGERERWWPWIAAGVLAAVTWLTRTTGLVLIPLAGMVVVTDVLATDGSWLGRIGLGVRRAVLWAGAAAVTTLVLWPVVWYEPQMALHFMVDWITGAATEGHELPVFFMSEVRTGDPGLWFYPVTVAWRVPIVTAFGVLVFAVAMAIPAVRRNLPDRVLQALAVLGLFAALYTVGMTLGAKKFDRYLLPVYPVLDIIAAVGIVTVVRVMVAEHRIVLRVALPVVVSAMLVVQAGQVWSVRPNYLASYNPLLGGAEAAEDVLQIGWGEGVDAAADWVIADAGVQPGHKSEDSPVLRISGGRAPLLYALPPPYIVESSGFRSIEDWETTDYYVATIQQWQRDISGDVIGYLRAYESDHTVELEGVRYVEVWKLDDIPPPPWLTGDPSCEWQFGPWLQLENIVQEGDEVDLWFQTLTAADLPQSVIVSVELVPRTLGASPVAETWSTVLEPRRERGWFTETSMQIPIFGDAYLPRITVVDAATGEVLPARGPGSDLDQSVAVIGSACEGN